MNPCKKCVTVFGKPLCTHVGCCVFEGSQITTLSKTPAKKKPQEILNA